MVVQSNTIFQKWNTLGPMGIAYVFMTLPYFFAGAVLGKTFTQNPEEIDKLYFWDLFGAGCGCLIYLVGMRWLGPVNLTLFSCLLVATPYCFEKNIKLIHRSSILLLTLLVGATLTLSDEINRRIVPEPSKAFNWEYNQLDKGDKRIVEFSEWNTISRTDVVSTQNQPHQKRIFTDGEAWSGMVIDPPDKAPSFQPETELMIENQAVYFLKKQPNSILVIGSGGGIDVWNALRAGAQQIDAIELNPTTARISLKEYRHNNGDLFFRKGVKLLNEEGRSFITRTQQTYDVIMSHATDTLTATSSGAYMLSENYLYTVEAFETYLRRLRPGGILSISRWASAGSLRLFTIALEALYRMKIDDPLKHVIASSKDWLTLLIRLEPFTQDEIASIRSHIAKYSKSHGSYLVYPSMGPPMNDLTMLFSAYANARSNGIHEKILDEFPFDVSPTFDDSPFFFQYYKWNNFWSVQWEKGPFSNWPPFILSFLLAFSMVAVFVAIFLPLLVSSRSGFLMPNFGKWTLYFFCLGYSYIFVEMALMQRFSLFLGHPSRSIAVVLGSLLISSGIGSYFSRRLHQKFETIIFILALLLLGTAFGYLALMRYFLGVPLWIRESITILMISPLSFAMGMPFPTGIRLISRYSGYASQAVPWMWGINGGATVLGAVAATVAAMLASFTTVILLSALGYLVAILAYRKALEMR